jgi:hypothetical protein
MTGLGNTVAGETVRRVADRDEPRPLRIRVITSRSATALALLGKRSEDATMFRRYGWDARHGLIGLAATVLVAWVASLAWRRRAGARLAAAEARMEPRPVVY